MSFNTVTNPQKKNSTVTIANAAGYLSLPPVPAAVCEPPVVAMAIVFRSLFPAPAAPDPPLILPQLFSNPKRFSSRRRSALLRFLQNVSAVHHNHLPRDVRRRGRRQQTPRSRNCLRRPRTAQRREPRGHQFLRQRRCRGNPPGRNRVDGDTVQTALDGRGAH